MMFNRDTESEPEFENERQEVKKLVDSHVRVGLVRMRKFRDGTIRPAQVSRTTDPLTVMEYNQSKALREILETVVLTEYLAMLVETGRIRRDDLEKVKTYRSPMVKEALAWKGSN